MMSLSEPLDLRRLTKLGRKRYILRVGVLGWGVPVAILFSLVQGFQLGWDGFLFHLIPALVLFPIGGIFFGMIMWRMARRKELVDGKLRE